jgi:hypothetical protein
VRKESERKRERERLRRLREEKLRNLYVSAGFIKISELKKIRVECAGYKVCSVQVRNNFVESLVRRHKDSTPPETPRLG